MHFKISLSCLAVLFSCITWTAGQDAGNTTSESVTSTTTTTLAPKTSSPKNDPETVAHFIRAVMKKYGEAKASEALQSLDELPLGLIMKILLVEVDKSLATDIVAMQRYAQGSDKTLINMIGRIVAGDKTVPKEIFAMDQKLMKFPFWIRIRARMFHNLEKYVAAYSVANGAKSKGSDIPDLAAAVAASATEAPKQEEQVVAASSATSQSVEPSQQLKLSLLTPIQQQQILETLALAKAVQANPQTQAQSQTNPFSLFG